MRKQDACTGLAPLTKYQEDNPIAKDRMENMLRARKLPKSICINEASQWLTHSANMFLSSACVFISFQLFYKLDGYTHSIQAGK